MKEFSFIKTSLWSDETFRQMTPEQKLVMLYLLQGTQTNWCGIFKLNISMMGFFLGLRDDNVQNAFQAFVKHFNSLVAYDPVTSEVAILNWGAMNLANMNEKSLTSAKRDLLDVESEELILKVISESKASRVVEFYTSGLNSIRATRRNLAKKRESIISQPPSLTSCESVSFGQIEIEREKERENNPLTPLQGGLHTPSFSDEGSTLANDDVEEGQVQPEDEDSLPPPPTWPELLRKRTRPPRGFSSDIAPNPDGNEWERRMYVFDAVRRKYPGTKGGLSVEFDWFVAKCHEYKIRDIDSELRQMPYAVLYQMKWHEVKSESSDFVPNWKNFYTWISKQCWQSDMEAWKSRAEWFNQMCSEETKEKVEALKKILPCK